MDTELAPSHDRLARTLALTIERQHARPPIDPRTFDASKIPAGHREALVFLVTQLGHIEKNSPRNLASVARAVPLPTVRSAYAAQLLDEIAHGAMFDAWLDAIGERAPVHAAARWGLWLGERVQQDAWLGVAHVALLTEFTAGGLLDELSDRVEEPMLKATLDAIRKDEARHKVIAVESIAALKRAGFDKRALARAFGPFIGPGVKGYFRDVFGHFMEKHVAALDIPYRATFDRTFEEAHTAIDRALAV